MTGVCHVPDKTRPLTWAPWAARPGATLTFVGLITLVRLVYLIWLCPYTLAEDEAHYWEWSRHLDWSYYSKGPGVAWVIALSTSLFGNTEWAVRLPAAISSAIGSLAVADTARNLSDDRRVGFVAAVLYQCVPPFAALSMLMTIDGPYLACWALACMAAVRATRNHTSRWMVITGLFLALGFLFKYTIVLLAIGLGAAAIIHHRRSRLPLSGSLGAIAAFALGLIPVLIWNAQHDWVTLRHLLGHLGLPGGDLPPSQGTNGWHYSPLWTLEYLAMLLIAGPPLFVGPIAAAKLWSTKPASRILTLASVPVLVFYLVVSLAAPTEGNWALGGFVGLVPLSSVVIPRAIENRRIPIRFAWRCSIVIGLATLVGFMALPWLASRPQFGHLVPIQRITGMRQLAQAATQRLQLLREQTGLEPFLVTEHYGRASQLAFYMPGHPTVYCAGSFVPGARKSQYDLWPQTNLRNPETIQRLQDRPALIFGGQAKFWMQGFDHVEDIGPLPGEPKTNRTTYQALRFRGFEPQPPSP